MNSFSGPVTPEQLLTHPLSMFRIIARDLLKKKIKYNRIYVYQHLISDVFNLHQENETIISITRWHQVDNFNSTNKNPKYIYDLSYQQNVYRNITLEEALLRL